MSIAVRQNLPTAWPQGQVLPRLAGGDSAAGVPRTRRIDPVAPANTHRNPSGNAIIRSAAPITDIASASAEETATPPLLRQQPGEAAAGFASAPFIAQVLAQEIVPEDTDRIPAKVRAGLAHYQAAVFPEISVIGPANATGLIL